MARLSISITVDNFATQTTRGIKQILCRGNVTNRDLSLERHLYEEITGKKLENRRVAPLLAANQNSENQHWMLAELVRFTPGMNDVFLNQLLLVGVYLFTIFGDVSFLFSRSIFSNDL